MHIKNLLEKVKEKPFSFISTLSRRVITLLALNYKQWNLTLFQHVWACLVIGFVPNQALHGLLKIQWWRRWVGIVEKTVDTL